MESFFNIDRECTTSYKTPKEVLEKQCEFLSKDTDNLVLGRVENYSGEIQDYIQPGNKSPMKCLSTLWVDQDDTYVDIQTHLGELSDSNFTYDFFLTSKHTPNYKYRIMFFRYGIGGYPVKVVYDGDIAKELDLAFDIECKSETEFIENLKKILESNKVSEIVNNLFVFNKMKKSELDF